jgi:hypothetical protein
MVFEKQKEKHTAIEAVGWFLHKKKGQQQMAMNGLHGLVAYLIR